MHRSGVSDTGSLRSLPTLIWRHACMHLQLQIQASLCKTYGLLLFVYVWFKLSCPFHLPD